MAMDVMSPNTKSNHDVAIIQSIMSPKISKLQMQVLTAMIC